MNAHVTAPQSVFPPGVEVGLFPAEHGRPAPGDAPIATAVVSADGPVVFEVEGTGVEYSLAGEHLDGRFLVVRARAKAGEPVDVAAVLRAKVPVPQPRPRRPKAPRAQSYFGGGPKPPPKITKGGLTTLSGSIAAAAGDTARRVEAERQRLAGGSDARSEG